MLQDQPPASSTNANSLDAGNGYIEHRVSKLDTLAGVAIKYGVEVADVKRQNGLVTDFQMFAHKTLRIPLCRRHPPSTTLFKLENASRLSGSFLSQKEPSNLNKQLDSSDNFKSRGRDKRPSSSAMNLLRGYYGLSSPAQQTVGSDAGMEMSSYKLESEEHSDDEPFSPIAKPSIDLKDDHSLLANGAQNGRHNAREAKGTSRLGNEHIVKAEVVPTLGIGDTGNERAVRRRFKVEAMNTPIASYEVECRQDIGILDRVLPVSGLSAGTESSGGLPVAILKVLDGALAGGKGKESPILSKVKKSSSTSSLQDQTSPQVNLGGLKYGSKVEAKSLSPLCLNQAGSRASSDGPPKPMSHRYKAALD